MASASYLVIEEKASGIFLDRFSADGESAGDTWHLSIEDAQEQAMYEFDGALNEWESVPDDVDDVRFWLLNRGRD